MILMFFFSDNLGTHSESNATVLAGLINDGLQPSPDLLSTVPPISTFPVQTSSNRNESANGLDDYDSIDNSNDLTLYYSASNDSAANEIDDMSIAGLLNTEIDQGELI